MLCFWFQTFCMIVGTKLICNTPGRTLSYLPGLAQCYPLIIVDWMVSPLGAIVRHYNGRPIGLGGSTICLNLNAAFSFFSMFICCHLLIWKYNKLVNFEKWNTIKSQLPTWKLNLVQKEEFFTLFVLIFIWVIKIHEVVSLSLSHSLSPPLFNTTPIFPVVEWLS